MAVLLALAGCGALPQPFAGNPGATGRLLAQPPPARLAVPAPSTALLPDAAADTLARDVAALLAEKEVPAVAVKPSEGDWRLDITATLRNGVVVPRYTVRDPSGAEMGTADGPPVPPQAWQGGMPAMLHAAALAATPRIAELLTRIDAERKKSDPNSLVNRPARVFVRPVTGAPGDGDTSLALNMRRQLTALGITVQDTPKGADFTVTGRVKVSPPRQRVQHVEIDWGVTDAAGHDRGKVSQLNDVPAGTLDGLWADVALVVAQEAAGGVKEVMLK